MTAPATDAACEQTIALPNNNVMEPNRRMLDLIEPGFLPNDGGDAVALQTCGFFVAYTEYLSNGLVRLCVQADELGGNHVWVTTPSGTPVIGSFPSGTMCWDFSPNSQNGNLNNVTVQHIYGGATCSQVVSVTNFTGCLENLLDVASIEDCDNLTAIVNINIDFNPGQLPFSINFGDFPNPVAIETSSTQISYSFEVPGTYEICITYKAVDGFYATCCDTLEITLPEACNCPNNVIEMTSYVPCDWIATLEFDLDPGQFPIEVDFGDGKIETVTGPIVEHDYPEDGLYTVCYRLEVQPGTFITCCEQIFMPGCCLNPNFNLDINPEPPLDKRSCIKPLYMITGQQCVSPSVHHLWEFSDGRVHEGPFPPDDWFENFVTLGQVCVTHTVTCCGESASAQVCLNNHPPGAFLGNPNEETRFTDVLPFNGQTVLQFIIANQNSVLPLVIEGTLIADQDADFFGGTWNMGKDAEVIIEGATPERRVRFFGTDIQSAAREPYQISACCRWKGLRSTGRTFIYLDDAQITDAEYAIHYPSQSVQIPPFPRLGSYESRFLNNYFAIKSNQQFVDFTRFDGNVLNGAEEPEHICGCLAVNAIDFRNVTQGHNAITLPINIQFNSASMQTNTVFNYEKAFNFTNTNLTVRGFDIFNLQDYEEISGFPDNNPEDPNNRLAGIGIHYSWSGPFSNTLDMDHISFSDFIESDNTRSVAVLEDLTRGRHTLRAIASVPHTSITANNVAGGYEFRVSNGRLADGQIKQNFIHTNGGDYGFGITGNFQSASNSLLAVDNKFDIGSNNGSTLNGGIILNSTNEVQQNFQLLDNTIDVSLPDGAGIGITNATQYLVMRNVLTNSVNIPGILLREGGSGTVSCNTVHEKPRGMLIESAQQNIYGANNFFANTHDIQFTQDASGANGSRIEFNRFDLSISNSLEYSFDAITGPQLHRRYNSWFSQIGSEANHPGPGGNVTASQFWRPIGAAVGSVHHPMSTPPALFIQANLPGIEAFPEGYCNVVTEIGNPEPEGLWNPSEAYSAMLEDIEFWSGLTDAQKNFQRQEIFGLLLEHPEWAEGSGPFQEFLAVHGSDFVGQSETLKRNWQALLRDMAEHQAALAPDYEAVDSLTALAQGWLEAMHNDTTLMGSLLGLLAPVLDEIANLSGQIEQADDAFMQTVQATASDLHNQNSNLDDSDLYTWSEKRLTDIALKWHIGSAPDAAAADDLRLIAQTCLADGGRAVLAARGLCEVWLKEHYSDDNCQTNWQGRPVKPATSVPVTPGLTITPNPAKDAVRVRLNTPDEAGERQVEVLNFEGKRVYAASLSSDTTEFMLSVGAWPAGIYAVRITAGGQTLSQTFAVQSR